MSEGMEYNCKEFLRNNLKSFIAISKELEDLVDRDYSDLDDAGRLKLGKLIFVMKDKINYIDNAMEDIFEDATGNNWHDLYLENKLDAYDDSVITYHK